MKACHFLPEGAQKWWDCGDFPHVVDFFSARKLLGSCGEYFIDSTASAAPPAGPSLLVSKHPTTPVPPSPMSTSVAHPPNSLLLHSLSLDRHGFLVSIYLFYHPEAPLLHVGI